MTKKLTNKDVEKLIEVYKSISEGTACTYDKERNMKYMDSILKPRCCVCRKLLEDDIIIVNDHKMHSKCRKKYPG